MREIDVSGLVTAVSERADSPPPAWSIAGSAPPTLCLIWFNHLVNIRGMAKIGETIKRLRKQRGWTQPVLARKAGLAEVTVARLECGMRTNLRVSTLRQLAKALGVPIVKLLE